MLSFQKKVFAYITYEGRLLVFAHRDFPESGIQVPGGTVEPGEDIHAAALREAQEETGLNGLKILRKVGVVTRDMAPSGLSSVHERHYFHLGLSEYPGDAWLAFENTPSDGSPGPIALEFFWMALGNVPALHRGLDEMLPELRRSVRAESV